MMKVKYYKCPTCNKKFKTLTGWSSHVESTHPDTIPEGFSLSRYFYFTMTGKTHGVCRTCKGDTLWNEQTMKYDQYCTNPECKKAYVKIAKQRMIGKYGKVHLLNDPDVQKKMLSNRKISGKYTFEDGATFEYVGSYEREFLAMLDTLMNWHSNDLISPSPHTYYYNYKNPKDEEKNQGLKFYIPDFYIPSLNLEIEVKQQTSTNQKFNEINRVKEKLKDEVLNTNKNVNYLKINDNDFTPFFEFLMTAKSYLPTKENIKKDQMDFVMESVNNQSYGNRSDLCFYDESIATEACKDTATARKFVAEVGKLAQKYDANYFVVTDGASGTRNANTTNSAVQNARDAHKKWEVANGYEPYEDWVKGIDELLGRIIRFNRDLNVFEYLIMVNGKPKYDVKREDFTYLYRTANPNEFKKNHGGVCWDYVAYEAQYFKKHFKNVNFKTFYVCFDNGNSNPTHTFLIFEYQGKFYYFESSWKTHMGIYQFDTEDDAINYVIRELRAGASENVSSTKEIIVQYDALYKGLFNITCIQYMDYFERLHAKYGNYKFKKSNTVSNPVIINKQALDSHGNTIATESANKVTERIFHLSTNNLDGKTIKPSIPDNYMTKNGYENNKVPRVCFATSIDNCLRAFSKKCTGMKLYIHVPDGHYDLYSPSISEVPDVNITSETWITEPVKMKCVGQIEVIGDRGEDGLPYKYGNKTAELYDWDWKWLKKSSSFANESYTTTHNCIIISCFAGVGKNMAIDYFTNNGFVVNSIEKTDKFSNMYKSDKEFIDHVHDLSDKSDILFIPYFLDMEKNHIKGKIDYWLVYPSMNDKAEYMTRYRDSEFTSDEISNLSINWKDMINDCRKCKISDDKKVELPSNKYVTDVILEILEKTNEISTEQAVWNETDKYPVYIILMHFGSALANIIKSVTKDEFSHACISFNSKLDPMYSFGNKKARGYDTGFVIQNPRDPFYKNHKAYYHVYAMYVNAETYHKMKSKLNYFIKNKDTLQYDLVNLFSVWMGKPSENSKKYFCSRFVMTVLSAGKEYEKVPSLYRPQELSEFDDISLVNKGIDFSKYDYRVTERNMERIKQGMYDEFAYESSLSSSIQYSSNFKDVTNIVDTLSENELHNICNGEFKNSPYVIYRDVLKSGSDPVAFVDVYRLPSMKKNEAAIVIATKSDKKYRNKGYMTMVVDRMFENIKKENPELTKLTWCTQLDNEASKHMALKYGFTQIEEDKANNKVEYEISLEGYYRITYDGEGIYDAFRRNVSRSEWNTFLASPEAKWLPKPRISYSDKNVSYFTEKGYQMFMDKTLPLFDKHLDTDKITTDYINTELDDSVIYKDQYQVVTEGYIFSNKDYIHNLDKWENGTSNILLITGLSRSGKTTLGTELSKKYRATLIELDSIENFYQFYDDEIHPIAKKWLNSPMGKEYCDFSDGHEVTDYTNKNLSYYMNDAVMFVINECKNTPNTKFIIEGLQIFNDCNPELIKEHPCIIKQTSMLKSYSRRGRKSFDLFKFYLHEERELHKFKKSIANESLTDDKNPRIIKTYGIYDDNNLYHACVLLDKYDKPLRGRSEMLITKGDQVYLSFKGDSTYKVPGGSWDENENHMMAAIRESKEEVRINTKNVVYSGLRIEYFKEPCKWVKENIEKDKQWYGYYSEIYVGEFASNYKGKIDEEDQDDMVYSGRFYPIKSVYSKLTKEHKQALAEYIITNKIDVGDDLIDGIAQEGLISFVKDIALDISHDFKSWKSSLGMTDDVKGITGLPKFTGIRMYNGMIEIRGINYTTLKNRIIKYYSDKSIYNIFLPKYNILSYRNFERKRISRAQIKIDYLYTPEFFALELVTLFKELGKRFRDKMYLAMAAAIYKNSWLSKADDNTQNIPYLDTTPANKLTLQLKDYQKDFIMNYPKLKAHLNLNGYILAFEQGLGKTITATALAECLKVDHVYIVCPNSLKENWAMEIRKYYKKYEEDPSLWRSEVFMCNQKQLYFDRNTTRFIITNIESIDKMFPYVMGGKNLLVIDECHNFRNLESKRTTQLLELRDKLRCNDVLAMSGTPIKAAPSEIAPILAMIDPTFTKEAAECFAKAFKLHETFGTSLVQTRFGKLMYRKEKDVLEGQLPEKFIDNFPVTITNRDRYVLDNVRADVMERFGEIYAAEKEDAFRLEIPFFEMTKKYSRHGEDFDRFKRLIKLITTKEYWPHEIDKMFCESYMKNIQERITSSDEKKKYQMMINTYVRFKMHCLGLAQGEILPKYRRDMFIDMYDENKETFFDAIKNNTKKTLIFTQFKDVANYIHDDLNRNDIGAVLITGDVKNRLDVLTNFKENDSIRVLVATSQTIGTGVTLVEATQMFFFGPPWREADFAQCSDRIHRIGQTDDVYIYTVVLDTGGQMNLSTRMESILSWSKRMTESVIIKTDNDEIDVSTIKNVLTTESTIAMESINLPDDIKTPEQLSTWMKSNIRYNHTGKFKSAEEVFNSKSGDCHDQSEFESKVFSKLKIPHGRIFMIEYHKWPHGGSTHTVLYFKRKNKFYWFENAWQNQAGIHGPYNSLKELRTAVKSAWNFSAGCDKLLFSSVKNVKPGMTLDEYVISCLGNFDINGPDPLGNRLANEVYSQLPNKELYDELIQKDEENKLNVYKEIPSKYLDKLISFESGFNCMNAIANYDIPKDVILQKRSVECPLGVSSGLYGKFKDMKFTKLGMSVFSKIEKGKGALRFDYVNENGFEYWNLITNRDIKKGETLSYDPNDGASFTDPDRM